VVLPFSKEIHVGCGVEIEDSCQALKRGGPHYYIVALVSELCCSKPPFSVMIISPFSSIFVPTTPGNNLCTLVAQIGLETASFRRRLNVRPAALTIVSRSVIARCLCWEAAPSKYSLRKLEEKTFHLCGTLVGFRVNVRNSSACQFVLSLSSICWRLGWVDCTSRCLAHLLCPHTATGDGFTKEQVSLALFAVGSGFLGFVVTSSGLPQRHVVKWRDKHCTITDRPPQWWRLKCVEGGLKAG
jgi:hypothetical protein